MSERLSARRRRPVPPPLLAAYLALMATLGYTSLALFQKLAGTILVSIPAAGSDTGPTRVQRWARLGDRRTEGEVRGWLARGDVPKPAIPIAAILGSAPGLASAPGSMTAATGSAMPSAPETGQQPVATAPVFEAGAGYRTVCVRLCDGAYFPVSFATTADRFQADETVCQASCGAPVRLFAYRNPGERPDSMVDRGGRAYRNLPAAFRFRSGYDSRCSCRGQPWEQVAQDRHRLYDLEARHHGNVAQAAEIEQIRERLALLRPAPAPASPPPVYAAAAPASRVVSDASATPAHAPPNAANARVQETGAIPDAAASEVALATADPGAPDASAATPAEPSEAGPLTPPTAANGASPMTLAAAEPKALPSDPPSPSSPVQASAGANESTVAATEPPPLPAGSAGSAGPVVSPAAGNAPPAPDIEVPSEVDSTAEPALDEVEPDDASLDTRGRGGDRELPDPSLSENAKATAKAKAEAQPQDRKPARAEKPSRSSKVAARSAKTKASPGRVVVIRSFYVRRFASRTPMEETRRNLMRGSF